MCNELLKIVDDDALTLETSPAFSSAHPLPSALNFLIDDKSAPDHLALARVQTD